MRIVQIDFGYVDMDHVQAVSEPVNFGHGYYGFRITLMLQAKPLTQSWDSQDLGVEPDNDYHDHEAQYHEPMIEAVRKKRDAFVELWRGESVA